MMPLPKFKVGDPVLFVGNVFRITKVKTPRIHPYTCEWVLTYTAINEKTKETADVWEKMLTLAIANETKKVVREILE